MTKKNNIWEWGGKKSQGERLMDRPVHHKANNTGWRRSAKNGRQQWFFLGNRLRERGKHNRKKARTKR